MGWEKSCCVNDPILKTGFAGLELKNPIGLAAGFDKNGEACNCLQTLGFGHIEIGSVSALPSKGNPRPRLYRLPEDEVVVVNYGVPNDGAEVVARRLQGSSRAVPLGINLVKTNDLSVPTQAPEVYKDYLSSFQPLHGLADYVVLNLSCPNSEGDRDFFDDPDRVTELLAWLDRELDAAPPVFLKVKPGWEEDWWKKVLAVCDGYDWVRGFAINLPSGKPVSYQPRTDRRVWQDWPGAWSGRACRDLVDGTLLSIKRRIGAGPRYELMAAGGVFTGEDAYRKILLGANVVQLYTALIFQGPEVVRRILMQLAECLRRDGFTEVQQAVGTLLNDEL